MHIKFDSDLKNLYCGGRGIRTLEAVSDLIVFKTICFNHSHIPPSYGYLSERVPRVVCADSLEILPYFPFIFNLHALPYCTSLGESLQ